MTVTQSGSDVVEREVRVSARPETIFPFLVEPEKMMRWMGVSAELDPRPGGICRVNVTGKDISVGEYVEVTPHSRVVFTWGWEGDSAVPPGSSTVEVSLIPDGDGTVVRLRHSGLPTAELRTRHAEGWEHFLARLAEAGAGRDPGPDPWVSSDEAGASPA